MEPDMIHLFVMLDLESWRKRSKMTERHLPMSELFHHESFAQKKECHITFCAFYIGA
jgi:hypothetical protein